MEESQFLAINLMSMRSDSVWIKIILTSLSQQSETWQHSILNDSFLIVNENHQVLCH